MDYTNVKDGNINRIEMKGKFTFSDHGEFKKLFDSFKDKAMSQVEFNMKNVEFVDSAALGLLLLARDEAEKSGKKLVIVGPEGQVKKMFEISRFYELFDVR